MIRKKALNFLLTIYASDKRALGFVSTDLCSISSSHVNRLDASTIERSLILHDKNNIIELVGKKVAKICHYFGDKSMHFSMSLGVDVTIIVIGWYIFISNNRIIGGASPNHSFDIGDKSK